MAQVVPRPAPPSEPEKSVQKAIQKRIVDPLGPIVKLLQERYSLLGHRSAPWLQPTVAGGLQMLPPQAYGNCPVASITSKFVHTCQNRTRCAVNCVNWTPEGRRCMTGDNIGQLSLWSSSDFKFEQLFQAHDKGLRHVTFTHNGSFLFSCDDTGVVRIFKANLAPLQRIAAHEQSCRTVVISASDTKFATCSDDQSVKVWDLATCVAERIFTGHGSDVKYVDWHPSTSLLVSGGRDGNVKLWDARLDPVSASLATLHGHKAVVNQVKWNTNGSWFASCSRDQSVRVWDIRQMKKELSIWQGHTRDVHSVSWHPIHLELLASGAGDGNLMFWMVGQAQHLSKVEGAHDGAILGVSFHPNGHMLASCAMEANTKLWVRQRPADPWRDAVQKEQEETSAYAELLASAAAGGATAAGQQGPAGFTAMGAAGGGQLPGGIAVQLPGMAGAGIPGIAGTAARPPGLAGARPPGTAAPQAAPAAAAAATMPGGAMPPGLMPGGGIPMMPGMAGMGVPGLSAAPAGQGLPGVAGVPAMQGLPGLGRGLQQNMQQAPPGMAAGAGARQQGQQRLQQQQQRGFKRQRDSDATGEYQQQHRGPHGGFSGRGLAPRGVTGMGSGGLGSQQQYSTGGRGGRGGGFGGHGPTHHAVGGRGAPGHHHAGQHRDGVQQQQQQGPPGHYAAGLQDRGGGFQERGGQAAGRGGSGRGFGRGFGGQGRGYGHGPPGGGRGYGAGRGRGR